MFVFQVQSSDVWYQQPKAKCRQSVRRKIENDVGNRLESQQQPAFRKHCFAQWVQYSSFSEDEPRHEKQILRNLRQMRTITTEKERNKSATPGLYGGDEFEQNMWSDMAERGEDDVSRTETEDIKEVHSSLYIDASNTDGRSNKQ